MKQFLKWFFRGLLLALLLFNAWVLISGNQFFYKALYHNFADIDDYKIFPERIIKASDHPEPWPISKQYNQLKLDTGLVRNLTETESIAFVVLRNDSLLSENYWDGYSQNSYSNSFSMAKSYIGAMVGIALKDGKIKSLDQSVSDFLPWFKQEDKKDIKIKHLLAMCSGLEWDEAYANPFSVTTEAYYGDNLEKLFKDQKVATAPGLSFSYKSGDTQLLGFILEKATGMSLSEYAQEKLWKPMGAEHEALWSLDREDGMEKAYCCINSNARDFARLGVLYLHKGNWKGKQILDSAYTKESTTPDPFKYKNQECNYYGYQWWIIPDYETPVYYARGILGQYIIVVPAWNMVAVRLGKQRGQRQGKHFSIVYAILEL